MKEVEELKGMTQEDLIRTVQELQEESEDLKQEKALLVNKSSRYHSEIIKLKNIIREMSNLL